MKHLHSLACIADVAQSGSIRKTAERLNLTPSALTRRIQDFEQELGTPLFNRTPQGMRLNEAGRLLVQHARSQAAEFDRIRAQIAGLSGLQHGHIALVCSQAFTNAVMPAEVGAFRAQHPHVTFSVQVCDYAQAATALVTYEAELALILQPAPLPELQVLFACQRSVCAVMNTQHPLAGTGPVRLRECLRGPVALPGRSLAVRQQLDAALVRTGEAVEIAVESSSVEFLRSYVQREQVLTFQISMGIPAEQTDLVVREIDPRDLEPMHIVLTQLRGRPLSTAASTFGDQLTRNYGLTLCATESAGSQPRRLGN